MGDIDFAFVFMIYRLYFRTGLMVYMYMCVKGYRLWIWSDDVHVYV
jgi:nicotinamide riboside transporter PnuC